jgi:Kef-type K+ transport system membrane component KefB/predicted amino acid-binding ACT domain protein
MDTAEILSHILIVLIAAKVAAEVAERIGIPAVVGEIVAGILVGPSVLNAIGEGDEVLRTLGEIGVILLLLEVGLEMDLRELGKVGRTSFLVATVGVAAPLVLGFGALSFVGEDFNTALFLGAALTATSVGITARVFGDLRALATQEARVVLGAAVADDVMGLVVLTVVVRLVTEGSVSALSVAGIIAVAVLFLFLGGAAGLRIAPTLFGAIDRLARTPGTLVALALAFTLAFAELANQAKLAPIIGAFLAGLALSRADQGERVRRELTPIGHVLIPVFFLQIGVDVDVSAFGHGEVLRDAAILLVVAVVGKLLSPLGAIGSPVDKPLVGLGMLPRGEVGLIFATIGLQTGVLSEHLYAALLLVVLATTLVTPPLLKLRYQKLRADDTRPSIPLDTPPPDGGWLRVARDEVDLADRPPDGLVVPLAFDAAIPLARRRPSEALLDWLADVRISSVTFDPELRSKLLDVIERGNARSWRFLESSGVLAAALPELAAALRRRAGEGIWLDATRTHSLQTTDRLRMLHPDDPIALEVRSLEHIDRFLLAAFLIEWLEDDPGPERIAAAVLDRIRVDPGDRAAILEHLYDRRLLWSAVHQPGALSEERVLELAAHLDTPERARTLYLLSALRTDDRERWEVQRLRALYELVQATLADDTLAGSEARSLAERRRADAAVLVGDQPGALERLASAPRAYVLRTPTTALANHARLLDPRPARSPRVSVARADDVGWWIDVAWHDEPGRLAAITKVLADHGLSIDDGVLATWPDGAVLDSFHVPLGARPDANALAEDFDAAANAPMESMPLPDAEVTFDNAASPWHTVCEVRCTDRPGLLHALATSLAAAQIEVRSANVSAHDGLVIDRFEVTDHDGAKLSAEEIERARDLVRTGAIARRRRFGRRLGVRVPSANH